MMIIPPDAPIWAGGRRWHKDTYHYYHHAIPICGDVPMLNLDDIKWTEGYPKHEKCAVLKKGYYE